MLNENGINVLSLFDGISVTREALKGLQIPVNNYYASEVDSKAMEASANNHNDITQLGDVRQLDTSKLPPIQFLTCGFPCQDLSSLKKNREGLEGKRSGLLYEAVRILKEIKPKYWLFENVASMPLSEREKISELLGVEPIEICSSRQTAQMRKRVYWTNIEGVTQPKLTGVQLSDIIEHGCVDREKSLVVLTRSIPHTLGGLDRYLTKGIGQVVFADEMYIAKGCKKATRELCRDSYSSFKIDGVEYRHGFRKMTVKELCRLQGLPDNYMDGIAPTTAHLCLGNAFTMPVIQHILSFAKF